MANTVNFSIMRWVQSMWIAIVGMISMTGFFSCGGAGSSSPESLTLDDAWKEFEAGDYSGAIVAFRELREADPTLTDALNGLGWSYAFEGDLDSAEAYYTAAMNESSDIDDARAGLSAVLLAQGDDDGAATAAVAVLEHDPDWSFAHYAGVNSDDLHLILAEAYFAQGESYFSQVQEQIDVLEPANDLDPHDVETWNGESSFAGALLRTLQELEEVVGADMML